MSPKPFAAVKSLSRHRFLDSALGALVLATGLVLSGAGQAHADGKLNMYNWSDYISDSTVPNFEKEFGVKMRYDTFDSNEVLHAKLVAGKTGYDIVVPSSNWARCNCAVAC